MVVSYLDPTVVLDVAFFLVATVFTMLSVHSLRLLARIRLEKSLFIPVITSAVFFWSGSLANMVYNLGLQSIPTMVIFEESINVLYRTMLLIGLSTLAYGVFSYWRITKNVRLQKHERLKERSDEKGVTMEIPESVQQAA